MSDSLIKVPFHGDTIEAVAKDGSWMASLRRMCENLDVDYWTQLRKLKEKPWATVVIMPMVGADGKNREMAMIDRRTMTMRLANINPGKVKPELRSKIEAYQCEAADALDKYFNEGAAIRFKTNSMDEESLILAKANQIQSRLLGEARRENLELRASNEKMRPLALLGEAFVSADGDDERKTGRTSFPSHRQADELRHRVRDTARCRLYRAAFESADRQGRQARLSETRHVSQGEREA